MPGAVCRDREQKWRYAPLFSPLAHAEVMIDDLSDSAVSFDGFGHLDLEILRIFCGRSIGSICSCSGIETSVAGGVGESFGCRKKRGPGHRLHQRLRGGA